MKVADVVKDSRLVLWLALLLAVDGCSRLLPATAIEVHGTYLWAGYLVLGCVLLGKRLGAFVFAAMLAIALLLDFASGVKIQLTQMPITVDDILITAMYPEGLWSLSARHCRCGCSRIWFWRCWLDPGISGGGHIA